MGLILEIRKIPWRRAWQSILVFLPGGGHGNPHQYSCLENPKDKGAWWATVHGSQWVEHSWSDWACTQAHGKLHLALDTLWGLGEINSCVAWNWSCFLESEDTLLGLKVTSRWQPIRNRDPKKKKRNRDPQSYRHKEMNSANDLSKLEIRSFPS